MGAGFESNLTQTGQTAPSSDAGPALFAEVWLPTQHVGERFNTNDLTTYATNSPVAKIYNSIYPSLVEVKWSAQGTATGFMVSTNGFMVTDHHVAVRAGSFKAFVNGSWHEARWVDDTNCGPVIQDWGAPVDLALMKVIPNDSSETFSPVKFAPLHSVKNDAPLVGVGFPRSLDKVFVSPTPDLDGKLHYSLRPWAELVPLSKWATRDKSGPKEDINREVIESITATQPGNSGTPFATLGHNGDALVVGITSVSDINRYPNYEASSVTLSTPLGHIITFLEKTGVQPVIASQ